MVALQVLQWARGIGDDLIPPPHADLQSALWTIVLLARGTLPWWHAAWADDAPTCIAGVALHHHKSPGGCSCCLLRAACRTPYHMFSLTSSGNCFCAVIPETCVRAACMLNASHPCPVVCKPSATHTRQNGLCATAVMPRSSSSPHDIREHSDA